MDTKEEISNLIEESQVFSRRYIEQLLPHVFEFERIGVAKTADDYYHLVEPIVSMVKAHDEKVF